MELAPTLDNIVLISDNYFAGHTEAKVIDANHCRWRARQLEEMLRASDLSRGPGGDPGESALPHHPS